MFSAQLFGVNTTNESEYFAILIVFQTECVQITEAAVCD